MRWGSLFKKYNIIILLIIFIISSICYVFWKTPFIVNGDEIVYKQLSYEIWKGQIASSFLYPLLYPLVISPAFVFGKYFWVAAYVINILLKAFGIFVIYQLLLRLVREKTAVLISILIAFSPIYYIYSRIIMAENLFSMLLCINVLFHMIYSSREKNENLFTIIAALLSFLLYETKYIGLILIPIFFLYWIYSYLITTGEKGHERLKTVLRRGGIYIGIVCGFILLYALYYAFRSQQPMTFKLLEETMGFYTSSAPGHTGYRLTVQGKWLICYSLYAILGMIPMLAAIHRRKGIVKQNLETKSREILLLAISMGLIYIAARHSSLIGYNDSIMIKLLGRYVSYATPLFSILFGIVYENTVHCRKKGLIMIGGGYTILILFSYWILYGGGIWHPAANWLDGVRGLENIAFLKMPEVYCVLLVAALLAVLKDGRVGICVSVMCVCYFVNALVAIINLDASSSNNSGNAMFKFIYEDEFEGQVLCMDNEGYGQVGPYMAFYSLDNSKLESIPIYNEEAFLLENDKKYIFALSESKIDTTILQHSNLEYTQYKNHEVLFIEWTDEVFKKKREIIRFSEKEGDDKLSFGFEYIPKHILFVMTENGLLIPAKEMMDGHYAFDAIEGYNGMYHLYDLTELGFMDTQI